MTTQRDPIDELRSELRESVEDDFRRAAEEDEAVARQLMLQRRTLPEVAFELLGRGDAIRMSFADERFVGCLIHTAGDVATMETAAGDLVHINLHGPSVLRVVKRAASEGRSPDPLGPDSFTAVLRRLSQEEHPVVMALPLQAETLPCYLEAIAEDHVFALDLGGQEWFMPLDQISAVIERA